MNPYSPKPLWARAPRRSPSAGRFEEAHAVLEQAVAEHPNLAEAWLRLADFRLDRLNDPDGALAAVEPALYLDPQSAAVRQSFIDIRDRFRALGELPPDTAPSRPANDRARRQHDSPPPRRWPLAAAGRRGVAVAGVDLHGRPEDRVLGAGEARGHARRDEARSAPTASACRSSGICSRPTRSRETRPFAAGGGADPRNYSAEKWDRYDRIVTTAQSLGLEGPVQPHLAGSALGHPVTAARATSRTASGRTPRSSGTSSRRSARATRARSRTRPPRQGDDGAVRRLQADAELPGAAADLPAGHHRPDARTTRTRRTRGRSCRVSTPGRSGTSRTCPAG